MKWYDILGASIALVLALAIYLAPTSNVEVYTVPITCNELKCVAQVDNANIVFSADSLEAIKFDLREELYKIGRHVRIEVRYEP
jgi:hypothetical protein